MAEIGISNTGINLHRSMMPPVSDPKAPQVVKNENVRSDLDELGMSRMLADDLSALLATSVRRRNLEGAGIGKESSDIGERALDGEGESKADKISALLRSGSSDLAYLLAYVRSLFPDDSDLVLVLRELLCKKDISIEEGTILSELLQLVLTQSDKKACFAGVNIALKVQLYAKRSRLCAKKLRRAYRTFLTSEDEAILLYEGWVEGFGSKNRLLVCEFIEDCLYFDMQSEDPSCTKEEFGALLGRLALLKKIKSSEQFFVQNFQRINELDALGLNEEWLLACWFDLLLRPFNIRESMQILLQRFPVGVEVLLWQTLLVSTREMSDELFYVKDGKAELMKVLLDYISEFQENGQPDTAVINC